MKRIEHEADQDVRQDQDGQAGDEPLQDRNHGHRGLVYLRSPRIARPIRTRVAPSAMADSKSSDIPIDSSGTPPPSPPPAGLGRLAADIPLQENRLASSDIG